MSKRIYCTYLTIYSGAKLPPFYIGYSYVEKIVNRNYHGTVTSRKYKSIWDTELHNNPHLFKTHIIKQFDSKQDAKIHEELLQRSFNVHKNVMYINQTINYQKFGSCGNCDDQTKRKISISNSGKKRTVETRKKLSNAKKGKKLSVSTKLKKAESMKRNGYVVWNKGKKIVLTDEQKCSRYAHRKGKPIKAQKIGTEAVTNSLWINDGNINRRIKKGIALPEGVVLGRIYLTPKKVSPPRNWYNDGIQEKTFESGKAPLDWKRGRLTFTEQAKCKMSSSAKNRNNR